LPTIDPSNRHFKKLPNNRSFKLPLHELSEQSIIKSPLQELSQQLNHQITISRSFPTIGISNYHFKKFPNNRVIKLPLQELSQQSSHRIAASRSFSTTIIETNFNIHKKTRGKTIVSTF
jgi:hypothetical protein